MDTQAEILLMKEAMTKADKKRAGDTETAVESPSKRLPVTPVHEVATGHKV